MRATAYVLLLDLASKTVRFRASGGGYGFGLTPGQFIGLSAIELAESIARENRRQAYLKQQLEVQQQLGKDQAQIDALQRQLAEVSLPWLPFAQELRGLALTCRSPGLMHIAESDAAELHKKKNRPTPRWQPWPTHRSSRPSNRADRHTSLGEQAGLLALASFCVSLVRWARGMRTRCARGVRRNQAHARLATRDLNARPREIAKGATINEATTSRECRSLRHSLLALPDFNAFERADRENSK